MKVIYEASIKNFPAWSGGEETRQTILDNNKADDFDYMIDELYPNGIGQTELNDILWFEREWIFESLGINDDDDDDCEEDDEDCV